MTRTRSLLSPAGPTALALLLACGGGGGGSSNPNPPTPPSTGLSYTDPATGTWQLKKNANSTPSHLILDLVANGAGAGAGVALQFTVDATKATWAKLQPGDPEYVRNGTVLALGAGTQAFKGKASGNMLQFVVSQKGLASPAALNGTVAQIALNPVSGVAPGTVALASVAGKTVYLDGSGAITPITVSIGTLSAN